MTFETALRRLADMDLYLNAVAGVLEDNGLELEAGELDNAAHAIEDVRERLKRAARFLRKGAVRA